MFNDTPAQKQIGHWVKIKMDSETDNSSDNDYDEIAMSS